MSPLTGSRLAVVALLVALCVATAATALVAGTNCAASDAQLLKEHQVICKSLVGPNTKWCGSYPSSVSARGDWPSQCSYFQALLLSLASPSTCLNTTYGRAQVEWVNQSMSDPTIGGSFMNQYAAFQPGYFNMPYKPGQRIESPWTLGEKCWAMAMLHQQWTTTTKQPLLAAVSAAGMSLSNFVHIFEKTMTETMTLCQEVQNNCFVNASYDPSRKGTCGAKVSVFGLGLDYENLKQPHSFHTHNPW